MSSIRGPSYLAATKILVAGTDYCGPGRKLLEYPREYSGIIVLLKFNQFKGQLCGTPLISADRPLFSCRSS